MTTSFLSTRRAKLILALLCAVAFLDFVDAPIVNVALPRRDTGRDRGGADDPSRVGADRPRVARRVGSIR